MDTYVSLHPILSLLCSHDCQRFDQGPSLLLLPQLFHDAFSDLGTSMEAEGVELLKCEPNYHLWFNDGECIELSTDTSRMKSVVEKWEGKDGFERYLAFLQESHRHYELSVTHVLKKNFTNLLSMLRPSFLPWLIALHPFESIYYRASKYFWTERLRRAFTFGSMYMGMSPYDAPGTYSLLQYTELAEGIWYPRGGFHQVVAALVRIGERMGVTYNLSTPVAHVNLSPDNRATGITLQSGESISADLVVINADLVYAYNNLLPPSAHAKSLSKRDASCSSISFYWAFDRIFPELETHNIFLAEHYRESFDSIFKKHSIPDQPSFYVNVPSRVDPTAAPPGKDSMAVLVPIGHLQDDKGTGLSQESEDWKALVANTKATILSTIQARTGADLGAHLVSESINTPMTWRETFNLDKGAILGLSHSFWNVLSFRPRTKHAKYDSLYFVGASTHPGTGVPICLAGSKIVSEQILGRLGMNVPWRTLDEETRNADRLMAYGTRKVGKGLEKEIDRVQMRPLASNAYITMMLVLLALVMLVLAIEGFEGVGQRAKGVVCGGMRMMC